jgi:hypothetical protein
VDVGDGSCVGEHHAAFGLKSSSQNTARLTQLVVELLVYSDQSPGWNCVEGLQGGCPCEIEPSRLRMGLC